MAVVLSFLCMRFLGSQEKDLKAVDQKNHPGLEKTGYSRPRRIVSQVPEASLQPFQIEVAHRHSDRKVHTRSQNHRAFSAWSRLNSSEPVRERDCGYSRLEKKELQGCSFLVLDKKARERRL